MLCEILIGPTATTRTNCLVSDWVSAEVVTSMALKSTAHPILMDHTNLRDLFYDGTGTGLERNGAETAMLLCLVAIFDVHQFYRSVIRVECIIQNRQ